MHISFKYPWNIYQNDHIFSYKANFAIITDKTKSHMMISINAEKACDKIQYIFMIKTLRKTETNRHNLTLLKACF